MRYYVFPVMQYRLSALPPSHLSREPSNLPLLYTNYRPGFRAHDEKFRRQRKGNEGPRFLCIQPTTETSEESKPHIDGGRTSESPGDIWSCPDHLVRVDLTGRVVPEQTRANGKTLGIMTLGLDK